MAFQVLVARQIGVGEACLILTERRTGSRSPIVEAFLLVPRSQTCYRATVFSLERQEFDVSPEALQEIDLTRIARQWAEDQLEVELIAWWRAQTTGTPLPDPVRFSESDRGAILSLWLRQVCPDSFRAMGGHTRDADLRQFMQMLVYLPTAVQHPMS